MPKACIPTDRNDPDKEPNCKDLFAVKVRGDLTPKQPWGVHGGCTQKKI